jgi:lipopolysaccharide export system protein LptA
MIALFAQANVVVAQEETPIEVLNAETLEGLKLPDGRNVRKLLGNVQLKQDSTLMYCDSAYQYEDENRVRAMSRVRIYMPGEEGRTTLIRADRIDYDGKTRIAELYDHIVLEDSTRRLYTDRMTYYRNEGFAKYFNGGRLVDDENVMTSRRGNYTPRIRYARFNDNVVLTAPKYVLTADSMHYQVRDKRAIFVTATLIKGRGKAERTLYTERGYYLTRVREAYLHQNPWYRDTSYTLYGDTLFFADSTGKGWAHCNVEMVNRDTSVTIFGERGTFERQPGDTTGRGPRITRISDHPYMVQRFESDTLTLFADSLIAHDDSSRGIHWLDAYYHTRFAMRGMQGRCDSLHYERVDSIMTLYRDPVLWADENQMTGDTIRIWMKNQQIDSLRIYTNGFMASREGDAHFNQLQAKQFYGKFRDNNLVWLYGEGNAESIFFERQGNTLKSMNQSLSRAVVIRLKNNKPTKISIISNVDGDVYPIQNVFYERNQLKRFSWRESIRPPRYLLPERRTWEQIKAERAATEERQKAKSKPPKEQKPAKPSAPASK